MNNFFTTPAVAIIAGAMLLGCATQKEIAKEYKEFQANKPKPGYVKINDSAVDQLGKTVALSYKEVSTLLDEYYAATSNNRVYTGFLNAKNHEMKVNKKSEKEAFEITKNAVIENDKKLKNKTWPKIEVAYKAVNALSPMSKLKTLQPLALESAKMATKASALISSCKGFNSKTLEKLTAAKKILGQAEYTGKATKFLVVQYRQTQRLKNYMK
jgi:hypothetical protein